MAEPRSHDRPTGGIRRRTVSDSGDRLVDTDRFEEWLELFTADCLYWVPTVVAGADPTTQLCTAFDDHRRLEDRIVRLRTGTAYSQVPPSRTCRTLSNFEIWESETRGEIQFDVPW